MSSHKMCNFSCLHAIYMHYSLINTLNAGDCSTFVEEDQTDEPLAKKTKLDGIFIHAL